MKLIVLLLASSLGCPGQQLWGGARYGMSRAQLSKLFGAQLKAGNNSSYYTLDRPERFCGADFQVDFTFFYEPNKGLAVVSLESRSGNPGGAIGRCVLDELTAKQGHPRGTTTIEGEEYWFGHWLSRERTSLYIRPNRVVINYAHRPPFIEGPQF